MLLNRVLRAARLASLPIALAAMVALTVLAFAAPTDAASTSTASSCATVQSAASAVGGGDASDAVAPSDNLDATRQCGGSPAADESRYEAILAGAGLVAFGAATLVYRRRRHHVAAAGA